MCNFTVEHYNRGQEDPNYLIWNLLLTATLFLPHLLKIKTFFFFKLAWYEQLLVEADGWKSEVPDSDSILDSPTNRECGLGQVMRVKLH